jgi:hypothetical protein
MGQLLEEKSNSFILKVRGIFIITLNEEMWGKFTRQFAKVNNLSNELISNLFHHQPFVSNENCCNYNLTGCGQGWN